MNMDSIGKNLRKFRLERKFKQEELAERTGLSVNYIGMLERGEKVPSLETFIALLNALSVSADMVLLDVLEVRYEIKNSILNERLRSISKKDRDRIYDVIETLMKYV